LAVLIASEGANMGLRRKLFGVWCGFTIIWWLFGIFGGDGALIALKFQVGGWRAGYVHLALTLVLAFAVLLLVLLVGRAAFWGGDQISKRRTRTRETQPTNEDIAKNVGAGTL
jgi:hypothetical protein